MAWAVPTSTTRRSTRIGVDATRTLVQSMYVYNPNPQTAAGNLRGNAHLQGQHGRRPGLPFNFWEVNPDVTNAQVVTNGPNTSYNGVQLC